jgi:YVTN family beta-propeller protein
VPATASAAPNPVTAYVINRGSSTVTPITVATNTPGTPIPVGNTPEGVAITADGTTAYVTGGGENRTRIRRQRAFAQLTTLLGYAYGRSARHASSRTTRH